MLDNTLPQSDHHVFFEDLCFGYNPSQKTLYGTPGDEEPFCLKSALDTVLNRLVSESDGNIALFLSGGVDSSYLGELLVRKYGPIFQTLTFAFNSPPLNSTDVNAATYLSKRWQVKNHVITVTEDALQEIINSQFNALNTNGYVNAIQMIAYASVLDFQLPKICLSGVGVDEILGSSPWSRCFYNIHRFHVLDICPFLLTFYRKKRHNIRLSKLKNKAYLALGLRSHFYPLILNQINEDIGSDLLFQRWKKYWSSFHKNDDLERFQRLVFDLDLETIQLKAFSLFGKLTKTCVRQPYLEDETMKFWQQNPVKLRWKGGSQKRILRCYTNDILPAPIINRKKQGLNWPWETLLKNQMRPLIEDILFDSKGLSEQLGLNIPFLKSQWLNYFKNEETLINSFGWIRLSLKAKEYMANI